MTVILADRATCSSNQGRPPIERRGITVIFPAYNEEQNIRRAIEQSMDAMASRFKSFELLIIDDGSRDNTGSIAEELAETYPQITVMHNERNMGLGESLYRGFQCAKGELVVQNAMDYPLDLRDLDKLLPVLNEADVVVAVRRAYAGYTPYRKLTSKVNRALLRLSLNPSSGTTTIPSCTREKYWKRRGRLRAAPSLLHRRSLFARMNWAFELRKWKSITILASPERQLPAGQE